MKSIDMTNVQEAGEFSRPTPGAYICGIYKAEDVSDKEYLKITYDIVDGEFKGYYEEMRKNNPDWGWAGAYVKSYKESALPMFKRFCTAVSRSNGKFVFDGGKVNHDEKTLKGKKVGLLYRNKEWEYNDRHGWTTEAAGSDSIDNIREGKFRLLKDKPLKDKPVAVPVFTDVTDEDEGDLPF